MIRIHPGAGHQAMHRTQTVAGLLAGAALSSISLAMKAADAGHTPHRRDLDVDDVDTGHAPTLGHIAANSANFSRHDVQPSAIAGDVIRQQRKPYLKGHQRSLGSKIGELGVSAIKALSGGDKSNLDLAASYGSA